MKDSTEGFLPRFRAIAEAEPGRVFASFKGIGIGFGELDRRSSNLARMLRARGIGPGERVAVMLRNDLDTLAILYGLAKAGVTWVPVNVQLRGDNLGWLLGHCEPRLAIAEDDLSAVIATSGASVEVRLTTRSEIGSWLEGDGTFDAPMPEGRDIFAIMYTSGTTGRPKGVQVTHFMLRLAGEGAMRVAAAEAGDVLLVWEPLYHIGGAQLLVAPLCRRVALAMVERFSAARFWGEARAAGATHIHFLGGILQILLKQPMGPEDRMHRVRIAWGGGCPAGIWQAFEQRFGVGIRECYGMTEASSITTCNDTGKVGSVGRAMPWFSVMIEDREGREASPGTEGEIVVRSDLEGALTPGYFCNPEATASLLHGGALHTGDLGAFDAKGDLFLHGRLSESVRCRGENVSAWEVEHVAALHPAVEECAMIGVAAEIGEQEIKLFLKPRANETVELGYLSEWLGARLAPYQNPRYLVVVGEFEHTPSLRIMKHRLSREVEGCFDRLANPNFPPLRSATR